MSVWCIYVHALVVDGRRYVGQTKYTMEARWKLHVRSVYKTFAGGSRFTSAIRKYGSEAFSHEVLEYVNSQWEADKAEARWIAEYNTTDPRFGFNTERRARSVFRMKEAPVHEADTVPSWFADLTSGPDAVVYEAEGEYLKALEAGRVDLPCSVADAEEARPKGRRAGHRRR